MGKGPKRRKGSDDKAFDEGHKKVNWSKKAEGCEKKSKPNKKGGTTFGPY